MNIAQVVCVYPPYKSGTSKVAYEYVKGLRALGHQVEVFTPKYKNIKKPEDKVNYLRPFLTLGNGAVLFQLLWKLRKFEVVHIHYPFYGSLELISIYTFFRPRKQKIFIHYHMDVEFKSIVMKVLSLPEKLFRKKLFKIASAITISSIDYAKNSQLKRLLLKYRNKLVAIPFGVDSSNIRPNFKKNNKVPELLFVSSLDKAHYFKGLDLLFKAIAEINTPLRLNVVGGGDMTDDYKKMCHNLNIENKVKFLGLLSDSDLIQTYSNSDLLVLPSINRNEAFGLVLLEAMSAGVAVIASDLPGVRKVFNDGQEGYYFKTGESADLKKKIEKIINNHEKMTLMGFKARKLVEEKYSWSIVAKKLEEIYRYNK